MAMLRNIFSTPRVANMDVAPFPMIPLIIPMIIDRNIKNTGFSVWPFFIDKTLAHSFELLTISSKLSISIFDVFFAWWNIIGLICLKILFSIFNVEYMLLCALSRPLKNSQKNNISKNIIASNVSLIFIEIVLRKTNDMRVYKNTGFE